MIKVYRICECDLVVTNKSIEETLKWYNEEYMDVKVEDVEEIDIDYMKINVTEDEDYEYDFVTVREYIADIEEEHMPMLFASTEY